MIRSLAGVGGVPVAQRSEVRAPTRSAAGHRHRRRIGNRRPTNRCHVEERACVVANRAQHPRRARLPAATPAPAPAAAERTPAAPAAAEATAAAIATACRRRGRRPYRRPCRRGPPAAAPASSSAAAAAEEAFHREQLIRRDVELVALGVARRHDSPAILMVNMDALMGPKISSTLPTCVLFSRKIGPLK